ncbi:hypothetical protein [Allokutzneria albata]|uniref:hypothetical protein n=1 Tax=Allokutzneria albata TaxID=211114 RepID=UPI0004C32F73|nr:hypothetical protein [Allokutzneria albata]
MTDQAYPHSRDDCDCCKAFDADMAAHYDGPPMQSLRWCQRCAGPLLTRLVLLGHTVSIRPLEPVDAAVGPASVDAGATAAAEVDTHRCSLADTDGSPVWTVELAEEVLRHALPSGSVFLRALINEGGTATADRLKELTGSRVLHPMLQTLNTAARKALGGRRLGQRVRIAHSRSDPKNPRSTSVHDYMLPAELVPIFDEALRRLGR